MKKDILINFNSDEIRIAITEEGKLAEFFVESSETSRNVGDIYLGKVAKLMPGIRAAFINIGFEQDAFLHFSDIDDSFDDLSGIIGDDSDVEDDDDDDEEEVEKQSSGKSSNRGRNFAPNIEKGQDVIVQITKEPVSKKGVRVASKVSLPGRYLVLLPFNRRIGISRKIHNYKEKKRLRGLVKSVLPKGFGVIVRTVASSQEDNLILDDLNKLISTWNEIESKVKTVKPPSLLYKDVSTTSSVIRDLFKEDISRVVVNSKKLFKEIKNYVDNTSPEFSDKVELYSGSQPLFDAYKIEKQIDESLSKKVWIKNYGYIIIETVEAMTVIDVNSGNYAKSKDQESNSLKIDIEAAREVVRQLRLRDIGGIIVVDFIDLYEDSNRRKLYDEIRKEFRKDRARVTVLPMSDFGLIQITRQRIRQNIIHRVSDTCPTCKGTGRVQSRSFFMTELERWLVRYKGGHNSRNLTLKVNPIMEPYLKYGIISNLMRLRFGYRLVIKLRTEKYLTLDDFKFFDTKSGKDITDEYSY